MYVLHGHEKSVSNVRFDSLNPSILISGSDDCTVKVSKTIPSKLQHIYTTKLILIIIMIVIVII